MRPGAKARVTGYSSMQSLRYFPLTGRLTWMVLLLVFGLGVLLGSRSDQRGSGARADEDFYPAWAAKARYNQPLWVRDTDSALGRMNLQPKQLSLRDLARVHGHLCDGLVISWVEIKVLLHRLFPQGVADRTDLRAIAKNGPCWADAAGWMTGGRVNHGTRVLDNAVGDGFVVQRISTGEAFRVWLKPGVFPADLANLERSIRIRRGAGEQVNPGEIDRFEALAADFSQRLLNTSPETVVEVEPVNNFVFPTYSPSLIAQRSDIINRDVSRARGMGHGRGSENLGARRNR